MQGFLEFAPANAIFRLPPLVRSIIDSIFVMVFSLLAYSVARFRRRDDHDNLTILENAANGVRPRKRPRLLSRRSGGSEER